MSDIEVIMEYRPLKRRFYILLTFSFFNFISGFLFNVWQPIMNSLKYSLHWSQAEINFQSNNFVIAFLIGVIPFIYAWNKFGIRFMYHLSILFFVVGTFLRLFVGSAESLGILIQVSNVITGFGSIMAITGPTVISALWFPNNERARATSISLGFNSLGNALAPTIASFIVPYNQSHHLNSTKRFLSDPTVNGLYRLIYLEAAMSLLVLIMILIYFPNRPPIAPSKSALPSLRIELIAGIKRLARNWNFWLVFLLNFILIGMPIGIGAIYAEFIMPLGLNQLECGILNTVMSIGSAISVVLGGFIGDKFRYKTIMFPTIFLCIVSFILWGLQNMKILPYDIYSIYALNIFTMSISSLGFPILYEMACEAAFPVKEEVSTALMAFSLNLGIFAIITVSSISKLNYNWIPFGYAVLLTLTLPMLYFYRETHTREDIDNNNNAGIDYDVIANIQPSINNDALLDQDLIVVNDRDDEKLLC